jgi:RNA polymerase sigma-70 factor (ECF subfamily)
VTKDSSLDITSLLVEWSNGDQSALDRLLPLVEQELHRLAHNYMRRENPNHTLQTTALVNEAYLRLVDQKKTRWQNRAHFFGIAATMMRRILMNYARNHKRQKRSGSAVQVSLSEVAVISYAKAEDLIALDQTLERLSQTDPRKARVVELRHFGGLTVQETAEVLGISEITVNRDWNFAVAWITREMACQTIT